MMAASIPPPQEVRFVQSAPEVAAYDFVEVTARVDSPTVSNPFTGASLRGVLMDDATGEETPVDGFCDSQDGSEFRIRFMPRSPGSHSYSVTYRQDNFEHSHRGSFTAGDEGRRGLLRLDAAHPWHFVWEGTGEHYFWNSTTAYWIAGWDDETIRAAIDRLHRLKVNRIRSALVGRVKDGNAWHEPNVVPTDRFSFILCPWVAARPDSVADPGIDVARFDVSFWRKYERMLRHARERDTIVSVIFYVDGARKGTDPFGKDRAGGEDEQRYYRYALARLAGFSNVCWDVTNEYRLFRDDAWAEKMGAFIEDHDPYGHLTSVHGHGDYRFRTSAWSDFAMYQRWDEHGGHEYMLENRRLQAETGRRIPQVNEEYGYEDHYPVGWGEDRKAPARCADSRRHLAWAIAMAGCYQTTGERADTGTGRASDTGGGWINGRGDDSMTMLVGYGHMRDFFESFEWWRTDPHDELVTGGAWCLAEPGRRYVVYLPEGGSTTLTVDGGPYRVRQYSPQTGAWGELPEAHGPGWVSPAVPAGDDCAFLLQRAGD
jgi:hypothetical protein